MKQILLSGVAVFCLLTAGWVNAAPITFFGQDQDPNASTANSELAHSQFLASLSSAVGTEDFEGFSAGDRVPLALAFPGSGRSTTATLTGDASVADTPLAGRFATSGAHYLRSSRDFSLGFSAPVAAFGFFGTDIGDFGGQITLTLFDGGTIDLAIPIEASTMEGNELFFGFIDSANSYTNIAFGNSLPGLDTAGFDDFTIGNPRQAAAAVPEPSNLVMFGFALLGLGLLLLRRRRA